MILARNSFSRPRGACRQGGHCRQGPGRGGCPTPLPSCPGHKSTEARESGRDFRSCFPRRLAARELVIKPTGLGISLLFKPSFSSHAEGALFGSCSCTSAQERCQSWLLRRTRPFKHRQPGTEVAGKGQQMRLHPRNREWTRVRTRGGSSSGFSRQNPGLACPSKERRASPGDPVYPVSITERISHRAKGPFLFCGFYRGPRGWLPLCMLKPALEEASASSIYSTKSKGWILCISAKASSILWLDTEE